MHAVRSHSVIYIALLLTTFLAPRTAHAGFVLGAGGDATNFAILYEGNAGKTLNFNNSSITGNIGIGGTGQWADAGGCAGQCMVNGIVEFSAANMGGNQFKSSAGTTYTPALVSGVNPLYNQTHVQDDLTSLNSLSQSLGGESGTATDIASMGSINASSGTLDLSGNRVFTATVNSNFTQGTTFTINGSASDYVVINVPTTGGHNFNGSFVLSGGITSDHVLINLTAGNYATLSGGDSLAFATNGHTTTGTFLDPNGDISVNNSVVDGRLFGGDSSNLQFVSGAHIVAPQVPTPEPAQTALVIGVPLAIALVFRRRKSLHA